MFFIIKIIFDVVEKFVKVVFNNEKLFNDVLNLVNFTV